MSQLAERLNTETQRKFDAKLREVRRLKGEISAMRQKAYFDRKFTNVKDYHDTVISHGNAVKELALLQTELNKITAANRVASEPFNIRFLRSARQILDPGTFDKIAAAAELMESINDHHSHQR